MEPLHAVLKQFLFVWFFVCQRACALWRGRESEGDSKCVTMMQSLLHHFPLRMLGVHIYAHAPRVFSQLLKPWLEPHSRPCGIQLT